MWRHARVISRDNCSQNGRRMAELIVLQDNLRDIEVDYMYIVRKFCIKKFHFFLKKFLFSFLIFKTEETRGKRQT